jgi:flagellar basal-body rod modification protein FlgD
MSIAAVAAQQSAAQSTGTTTASTSSTTGNNALASLSSNFQDFLGMLMTQLQNQDPTSPMDTDQFTNELVEFSGVEQQINTNSALTQLISLTQSGQLMQSSSMVGHTVELNSTQMPLQNSSGSLTFTAATAGPAEITLTNSAGAQVLDTSVNASSGSNSWTWNGQDAQGNTLPDGPYTVTVTAAGSGGTGASLPFTVSGTVTGVVNNNGTLDLQLGSQTAAFSTVQSVSN